MAEEQTLGGGDSGGGGFRAEIDTSAPFESVKEAVTRFGGLGFWKPNLHNATKPSSHFLSSCDVEEIDVAKVEEQAAELAKELKLKEKDTLEVLKELEATKMIVEELKSKLQTEQLAVQLNLNPNLSSENLSLDKENNPNLSQQKLPDRLDTLPSSSPGLILMELKQAKLNLSRTTSDLAEIRASVEFYNKKIEKERISLEKTRERLRSNSLKISSLEEEIDRTKSKLQEAKDSSANGDFTTELRRLGSEVEQTKAKIETAEVRLIAARRMNEASMASEAVALAEINALEKSESLCSENPENVTLTLEDYSCLRSKARQAEEICEMKVLEAMVQVEVANVSKSDVMKRVEEAMDEVKTSRKALEEALSRVENANIAKLAVEEALRKWRSEHGEKRRSVQNLTKFKNPCPSSHRRKDSRMIDLNGINLVSEEEEETNRSLKSTLSIGQILSRKLLITEEYGSEKSSAKKVSLGQMLGKKNTEYLTSGLKMEKDVNGTKKVKNATRKKFGFARFSVLLNKQSKKKNKKKTTSTARLSFLTGGCRGEPQVNKLAVVKCSR